MQPKYAFRLGMALVSLLLMTTGSALAVSQVARQHNFMEFFLGAGSPVGSYDDVVVLGGALAGSATALLLKRSDPGLRVIVVDKEAVFDRKVGESAIELSSWFLTRMLGLSRHLSIEHLPKFGLRFWFENDRVRSLSDASELGNRFQTRMPSYHDDRAVLDEHVHDLARAAGAEVLRPARAIEAETGREGRPAWSSPTGEDRITIEARWLVDATGRASWLARKVANRIPIRDLPTRTVWARFRGLR